MNVWVPGVLGFIKIIRRIIRSFATSSTFDNFLLFFVFLNTLVLAAEGLVNEEENKILHQANLVFTIIFTIDMLLKWIGQGLGEYFSDIMNTFDCVIVILSLIEIILFGP